MVVLIPIIRDDIRRAPYGARGLKLDATHSVIQLAVGRAPYGARGLK